MNNEQSSQNQQYQTNTKLLSIVLLNVVTTWLHYTDNALSLDKYTGFPWFTPANVISTVAIMTPVGIAGYWLHKGGHRKIAYFLLGVYSITSLSSLGHYLLPGALAMPTRMHISIWMDGIAGLLLISFLSRLIVRDKGR